jgi:hypothetical protein
MESPDRVAMSSAGPTLSSEIAAFSEKHFEAFKAAHAARNTITFFPCCFTFISRKKNKTTKHSPEGASTLLDFFSKYHIETIEQFTDVLFELSMARTDHLESSVPTYNKNHEFSDTLGKRKPELTLDNLNPMNFQSRSDDEEFNRLLKAYMDLGFSYLGQQAYMTRVRDRQFRHEDRMIQLEHRNRAYEGFFEVEHIKYTTEYIDQIALRRIQAKAQDRQKQLREFPPYHYGPAEEYVKDPPESGGFLHETLEVKGPDDLKFKSTR